MTFPRSAGALLARLLRVEIFGRFFGGDRDQAVEPQFEVCMVRGVLIAGEDDSPIERVLAHCVAPMLHYKSLRPADQKEQSDTDGQYGPVKATSMGRQWLQRPELQRVGEVNAAAIAAGGCVDAMLYELIDDIRRHCWRWLIDRPWLCGALVRPFLIQQMRAHFQSLLDRWEWDFVLMREVALDHQRLGQALPVNFESTAPDHPVVDMLALVQCRLDDLERDGDRLLAARQLGDDNLPDAIAGVPGAIERLQSILNTISEGTDTSGQLSRNAPPVREHVSARGSTTTRHTRIVRGRIKKASKLFWQLGHHDLLRSFVNGEYVVLRCKSGLEFHVRLADGRLNGIIAQSAEESHWRIPFYLEVVDRATSLGKLCAYAADTPILDFLLALVLHVESGSELDILQKANWYDVPNAVLTSETLRRLYGCTIDDVERRIRYAGADHEEWHDYRGRPFDLTEWVRKPEVQAHLNSELWPSEARDWLQRQDLTPHQTPLMGASFESVARYDAARLDPLCEMIDGSIAEWMGRALARWSNVRGRMEQIHRGYNLWKTPHGWTPPNATVFSSVVFNTDGFVPPPDSQRSPRRPVVLGVDAQLLADAT